MRWCRCCADIGADQAQAKLAAGREYENSQLVFASAWGKPLHLDLLATRFLKPWIRQAAVQLAGFAPVPVPPGTRAKAYREALDAQTAQQDDAMIKAGMPAGIGLYFAPALLCIQTGQ